MLHNLLMICHLEVSSLSETYCMNETDDKFGLEGEYREIWGNPEKAKILVLGTDHTAPDSQDDDAKQRPGLRYPFGLPEDSGRGRLNTPYFWSIRRNLCEVISSGEEKDIDDYIRKNVLVANAVNGLVREKDENGNNSGRLLDTSHSFQKKYMVDGKFLWMKHFECENGEERLKYLMKNRITLLTSYYLLEIFVKGGYKSVKYMTIYEDGHKEKHDLKPLLKDSWKEFDIALLFRHRSYRMKNAPDYSGYVRSLIKKYIKE